MRARYTGHRPNPATINRALRGGRVADDLDERARRVLSRSRQLVRVNTGLLISTGRIESGPAYRDVVYGRRGLTDYLGYEHDGTPPHIIRPRRRRVLRFVIGGRVVFARQVRHPGTRGSKFLTRALGAAR